MSRYEVGTFVENTYGLCFVAYFDRQSGSAMLRIVRPTGVTPSYYDRDPECYPMPAEEDNLRVIAPTDITDEDCETLVRLMVKGATK